MGDTREKILFAALRLFAAQGYEAVSVSQIAGVLGMTKGALYRHYASKRDIFDSIVARMEEYDAVRAEEFDMPEAVLEEMPEKYRNASISRMIDYSRAQFRYWTVDEFPACFRRMLTLEQYHNEEMGRLYQQYLVAGPLGYVTDLLASSGVEGAQELALEMYAPMFFLYSLYDGAEDKEAVLAMADAHWDRVKIKRM